MQAEATRAASERAEIPARLNLALLMLASLASAALLYGASHAGSAWMLLACAAAFSFTANTLFSLLHEAVHGLFAGQKALNEWAGRWAAAWFPTAFAMQRAFHLTHHRNNRSAAEQFDVLHAGDLKWLKRAQWYAILTGLYWLVAVAGVLTHLAVPRALRKRLLRLAGSQASEQTSAQHYLDALDGLDPIASRLEVLASIGFQVLLFWALDLSLVGWAACYAAFAFSWSSLQYTDHAFSPLDARAGAWNLHVGPVTRAFFLNYHFHLAHHRRPWLPWIHLPRDAEPGPRFMEVWREAWRGPRPADRFPRFTLHEIAPRPAWAIPTGIDAAAALVFSLGFTAVFVVLFGGTSVLAGFVPWHVEVALPFELGIPFRPAWSVVYLSMIPLLLLLPLARPRWQALFPVLATLVAETLVASLFFIALPVRSSFPVRDASGTWDAPFQLADLLNMDGNLFPSLHVAFAFTAALALSSRVGLADRLLFFAWAAAIAASTLLIHEHHVVDVVAGVLLALLAWHHVPRWACHDDVLAAVDIELLCLRNEWLFARRHRRYGFIALLLLVDRLPRWRQRRVLSTGFCFLQAVDDLMDGDRPSDRDPLLIVDELMQAIREDRYGDDELMRLGQALVADLRSIGRPSAVDDLLAVMAVMRSDRCRVVEQSIWELEALRQHHRNTFTLSLNLLLAARGSDLRAADAPELIEAFGWCSVVRDLREDLQAGLVNVPAEVLRAAQIANHPPIELGALLQSAAMQTWMKAEHDRALTLLGAMPPRLEALATQPGVEVLRIFTRSIRGFAGRPFARLYPQLAQPADPQGVKACH
ncbi:fatty acid desaturase [Roseateles sp. NT4]|uniref:fatty acid desaturase n=1 Tax=Roseateles sp. NT4 TaxID=3453715 RepID=UPI003EEF24A0